MTTTTTTAPWALDSNQDELDPSLQDAHRRACSDRDVTADPPCPWLEAELTEPILLRGLLSAEVIDQILAAAAEGGVWPRGVSSTQKEQDEACVDDNNNTPPIPSPELESVAHHLCWSDNHVVLYMHMNDHWFVRTFPTPWACIRGGMESRADMPGMIPMQDPAFVGCEASMMQVRTIELHHYSAGGGLVTPGHRDYGSDVTMSILLSHPADVSGGDFVTYDKDGSPVGHKMERGDAILFQSEKLHNISTVKSGVRKSLVVELWPSKPYY